MVKNIVLPSTREPGSTSRAAGIINAARSVFSPTRFLRSQPDIALRLSSSQASRDPQTPNPPNARSHRDAISAAHPPPAAVMDTPIQPMRRLLHVRPPSPTNQINDETEFEDEDSEDDRPATQPPEIAMTAANSPIPPSIFADQNRDYIPSDDSNYPSIPSKIFDTIKLMLKDVWGIEEARTYQVKAIFYMAFLKTKLMYLIRKTGEGKSLVLLGSATILRGVTVCLVPLLGLGSSHASNSNNNSNRVESYHVDEYRDQDFDALQDRMRQYSLGEESSIILYISPQNLQLSSKWCRLLDGLATAGFISLVCIDEAHACVETARRIIPS